MGALAIGGLDSDRMHGLGAVGSNCMRRLFAPVVTTFFAGLLAILPLIFTIAVVVWVSNLAFSVLGPESIAGRLLNQIGLAFATERVSAYVMGAFLTFVGIYMLGMVVRSRLSEPLWGLAEGAFRRVPVLGQIYDMSSRLVGVFDRRGEAEMKGMSPVWCLFGGDGCAVLALLPSPKPVKIAGRDYVGVLIPTAPVPFGGALLYVPTDWVKPADFGVETLTSVYVTMGATPPEAHPPRAEHRLPG
jgi:uncharacterized membrane protein